MWWREGMAGAISGKSLRVRKKIWWWGTQLHRETLPPRQPWKIKRKKVISFQERKRTWVSVDLGQSEEWRSSPMWTGLSKFGPKHPTSGTFFPYATALRSGDQQRPTQVLMELRKGWRCSTPHRTSQPLTQSGQCPLALSGYNMALNWHLHSSKGQYIHLSLSRPEAVAGLRGTRSKWCLPVLKVWSPAQQYQYHVGY